MGVRCENALVTMILVGRADTFLRIVAVKADLVEIVRIVAVVRRPRCVVVRSIIGSFILSNTAA